MWSWFGACDACFVSAVQHRTEVGLQGVVTRCSLFFSVCYLEHGGGDVEVVRRLRGYLPHDSQACQPQRAPKVIQVTVLDDVELVHCVLICLYLQYHYQNCSDKTPPMTYQQAQHQSQVLCCWHRS